MPTSKSRNAAKPNIRGKTSIREKRITLNMTQEQLANEFGVTTTTLARWERGESRPDAPGMLNLAIEALEAKRMLKNPDFLSTKEATKRRITDTLIRARKRVRHTSVKEEELTN